MSDPVTVGEATPEECRAICLDELHRAANADSLVHMAEHMRTALVWAKGANWADEVVGDA